MGMVTSWMGGSYYSSGDLGTDPAPDRTVWNYMNVSGLLNDYYHEWDGTFEGIRISYDAYMYYVDQVFLHHSDMKDYLRRESSSEYASLTYDESTDEISWFPRDSATRAQVALIINNYVENVKA